MGALGNFANTVLDSINGVTNVIDDYTTKEAKRSTQNKQIQLKKDVNAKMMEIQRSSSSDEWQTKIDNYFQSVKGSMSDKNSAYYCKNNLQAEMFDSILSEAQVNVTNEVQQLVFKADRTHALVEYQNTLETLAQTETPENQLRLGNEAARNLFDCGYINEDDLQQQYDNNFNRAYINTATKLFDDTVEEAIKRGDSEQTVIDMVFKNMPELIATNTTGLPKMRDTTQLKETLTKTMKQDYKAKQQDIWDKTEKQCAQIYDTIMDQTTAEGRNLQKRAGRVFLDSVKNTGLISADQLTKWTARFALEDYLDPAGTTTKSQAVNALSKMKPEDQMDFFIGQWKKGSKGEEGGIAGLYNAYDIFKESVLKQAQAINPDATWTDIERECPVVMQFYERAKKEFKNIPGMSDVIDNAEKMLEVIGVDETNLGRSMDIVYDMLFEADVSDMDGPTIEKYVKRVAIAFNSLNGNALEKQKNYEWLKDEPGIENITNFKLGVTGNEKNLAQALYTLENNPDIVYKDKNQKVQEAYGMDIKRGLINIEAEEKNEIARYIKATEGRDINTGAISSDWEEDGAYDVKATRVYTVGNQQYRLSSPDGKSLVMETKKAGEDANSWKQTQKTKEIENANSLGNARGKKQNETESNNKIMASTSMPKAMQASGKFTDDDTRYDWVNTNNLEDRQYMLRVTANRISSDAGKVYTGKGKRKKDSITEAEFKQKYGISYNEWMATSDPITRWNLILNSK